jgi:RHS repeat-associated protein
MRFSCLQSKFVVAILLAVWSSLLTGQTPNNDDDFPIATIIAALRPVCSSLTATPQTTAAQTATPITLQAICSNTPTSYEWRQGGQLLATTTSPSFQAPTPAGDGAYSYSVTARRGNIASAPITASVSVTPAESAQFSSQNILSYTMNVGQQQNITVYFKNTGSTTWSSGAGYSMISQNPANNTTWTPSNSVAIAQTVVPNGTASFYFTIYAPPTAGIYNLQWRMAKNGVGFGDLSANAQITINGSGGGGTTQNITLNSPTNNAAFSPSTPIQLSATPSGNVSVVTSVKFYANGAFIANGVNNGGTWIASWNNASVGNYNITANAYNSAGTSLAQSSAAAIAITPVGGSTTQTYTFDWAYDANGHLSQLTYPDGTAIAYAPNALGETTQVGIYASAIRYHPNGAVSGFTYGNNIAHSQPLNARQLPAARTDAGVLDDVYAYDAHGNITSITDRAQNISTRSMQYDGLDRLIVTTAPGMWGNASYTYDALDNLRVSTLGGSTVTRNYESNTNRLIALNQASGNTAISYDTQGNVSQRGTQAFVFDLGNRLASATGKASYTYDGHGRRILTKQTDGTVKQSFYSKAGQLLYSIQSGGPNAVTTAGTTKYLYLGSREVAEIKTLSTNAAITTQYVHTDGLGSPVAHTNTSGTLVDRSRYEPYGANAPYGGGVTPTGIGFAGHVNDVDTGLVQMQQRYYDPVAGRFLSLDPVLTDTNTGGGFNRYNYANNNPYRFVDPDGNEPQATIGAAPPNFFRDTFVGGLIAKTVAPVALFTSNNVNPLTGYIENFSGDKKAEAAISILTAPVMGTIRTESQIAKGLLAEARYARDALAESLFTELGKRAPLTVTGGYNSATREVAAAACGGGKCAENLVSEALGGGSNVKFTEAVRPRNSKEVKICERCESTFGRDAFSSSGAKFRSDGGN